MNKLRTLLDLMQTLTRLGIVTTELSWNEIKKFLTNLNSK